jgi:hypothetical protein
MSLLILQAREGLAAVFAGMTFSPRVFSGTQVVPPPHRRLPEHRYGLPYAGVDTGADGAGKVGTSEGVDVDVDVDMEAEAKAGEGAGAMARSLRPWSSSGWTYSTLGRGMVRRAGAEPVAMTE